MKNKICLITGCNSGIGKVTAIELAKKGFEIIMLVRDSEKSRISFEEIKSASGGKVILKYVDLASLDSIKKISEEIKLQYDRIANDIGLSEKIWKKTEELTGINYIE